MHHRRAACTAVSATVSMAYGCEVQIAASPALGFHVMTRVYVVSQMQAQSFASRSPLASTQAEVNATVEKEWDRVLLTTLGVAGKRVYEMRVQSPSTSFQQNAVSGGIGNLLHVVTLLISSSLQCYG
jgi:uncharacterized lipoprotein NlpE involved in copper resistance